MADSGSRRRAGAALAGAVAVTVLGAGCGAPTRASSGAGPEQLPPSRSHWAAALSLPPASGRQVAVTPDVVATVMLSALPGNTFHRYRITQKATKHDDAYLGARLTYAHFPGAPDPDPAGDLGAGAADDSFVEVRVYPAGLHDQCGETELCADLGSVHGSKVTMRWFTSQSEGGEGPGELTVAADHRDGSTVLAYTTFDTITTDPRKQHLTVGIAQLRSLVANPRLGLTTDRSLARTATRSARLDGVA